jgi:DNA-binding beta-propeller fold protein YncE
VRKRTIVTVAATIAAVAAAMPANAVSTKAQSNERPVAQGLAGPLQIDVNKYGIAVGQSAALTISKIRNNGTVVDLTTEPGDSDSADVAGVLLTKRGIAYTTTNFQHAKSRLRFVSNSGSKHTIAVLSDYEQSANPDQGVTYGFHSISNNCASQWPSGDFGPPTYTGIVDSHPYALAKAPGGGWYVAEAAGNDILWVSPSGDVQTVALLKSQATMVTQAIADANGFPDCVVGKKYFFEPVPTDVQVRGDKLIVSLLPGGPEDPSFGARGKVVRVDPETGRSSTIAGGFVTATNVAVAPGGRIFVANLFANTISKINRSGGVSPYAQRTQPAAVDWFDGHLYVADHVFGNGRVVELD